jgi:hypothetical protein
MVFVGTLCTAILARAAKSVVPYIAQLATTPGFANLSKAAFDFDFPFPEAPFCAVCDVHHGGGTGGVGKTTELLR